MLARCTWRAWQCTSAASCIRHGVLPSETVRNAIPPHSSQARIESEAVVHVPDGHQLRQPTNARER